MYHRVTASFMPHHTTVPASINTCRCYSGFILHSNEAHEICSLTSCFLITSCTTSKTGTKTLESITLFLCMKYNKNILYTVDICQQMWASAEETDGWTARLTVSCELYRSSVSHLKIIMMWLDNCWHLSLCSRMCTVILLWHGLSLRHGNILSNKSVQNSWSVEYSAL